jgi:hypothetical protein
MMHFKPTNEMRKLVGSITEGMDLSLGEMSFVIAALNDRATKTADAMVTELENYSGRYTMGVLAIRKKLAQERYLYSKAQEWYDAQTAIEKYPKKKQRRKKRAK